MFVYGIRCNPANLQNISGSVSADYYMDYGLLVFTHYTKTTGLDSHGYLSPYFWAQAKQIVENPSQVAPMDFEHPWITDEEQDVITTMPLGTQASWFYVPKTVA
jgi:hypothetical protein